MTDLYTLLSVTPFFFALERTPVDPKEGDVHPVGALPAGTVISQIELRPGEGAMRCRSAGASAVVLRRGKAVGYPDACPAGDSTEGGLSDDHVVVVRDNGTKRLLRLLPQCMVVVGQVSNVNHNKEK